MSQLTVQFDGREWQFDDDKFTLQQAIAMHYAYGFTLETYAAALQAADARALQCMYWLMLQQNGVIRPIKEVDADLVELVTAWGAAIDRELERLKAEEAAAAPPEPEVPTLPAGPASPESGSPTATTQAPRGRREVPAATGS